MKRKFVFQFCFQSENHFVVLNGYKNNVTHCKNSHKETNINKMKITSFCNTYRCYPYNIQHFLHTHTNLCVVTKIGSYSFITCSFFFSEYITNIFQVNKCTSIFKVWRVPCYYGDTITFYLYAIIKHVCCFCFCYCHNTATNIFVVCFYSVVNILGYIPRKRILVLKTW